MRAPGGRRARASLRGWGGVAGMATGCALAGVLALLLPLAQQPDGQAASARTEPARGAQARAEDGPCAEDPRIAEHPEWWTVRPSADDGETIARIKAREGKKRKLIVGVDQNSYRWGYRDPNKRDGRLEGFDIDLARRIAEDVLGDRDAVQFKAIPTNRRVPAIESGEVDMVVRTMTITCDRMNQVAFSAPYFRTGQQLLAPKDSPLSRTEGYADKAALAGRRICTAEGSTALAALQRDREAGRLPRDTDIASVQVPNQLDCLVRLQLGEVDAVVTDGALAASQAAQDPTVELKGKPFTEEYYGVALHRDAVDLVARVNHVLEEFRADDRNGWRASYAKWLEPTLGADPEDSEPPAPRYLRGR